MHDIDRGLLLVFPKKPFVDWLNSVDPDGRPVTLQELWREPEAILVKEFDSEEEAQRLVKRVAREIFEHLLMEWHTNPDDWPGKRDYATFRRWFDVRSVSTVFDQVGKSIQFLG